MEAEAYANLHLTWCTVLVWVPQAQTGAHCFRKVSVRKGFPAARYLRSEGFVLDLHVL